MTKFERDFIQFINDNYKRTILGGNDWGLYVNFCNLPIEMQFGVYQLFAGSQNYEIEFKDIWDYYFIKNLDISKDMQEAVKQFKQWYNEEIK